MIELVLVYCLANDLDRCFEPHEVREPVGSAMACAVEAQPMAREYVASHPRYRLKGWRCEIDHPPEAPA